MLDVMDIEVRPLSTACGAEILGVDLREELPAPIVDRIKRAWLEHLVIVFRDQDITQEQQLRFAAHFGQLGERKKAPAALAERTEGIYQTDKRVLLVSNIKVEVDRDTGLEMIAWIEPDRYEGPHVAAKGVAARFQRRIKGPLSGEQIWDRSARRFKPGWGPGENPSSK